MYGVKSYGDHLHNLAVLENNVIRIINTIPPRTNTHNSYVIHDIVSVKRIYFYNVGLLMYKYSN